MLLEKNLSLPNMNIQMFSCFSFFFSLVKIHLEGEVLKFVSPHKPVEINVPACIFLKKVICTFKKYIENKNLAVSNLSITKILSLYPKRCWILSCNLYCSKNLNRYERCCSTPTSCLFITILGKWRNAHTQHLICQLIFKTSLS